jgi:hypothetical protein
VDGKKRWGQGGGCYRRGRQGGRKGRKGDIILIEGERDGEEGGGQAYGEGEVM